jgi:hypothetical protein
MLSFERNEPVYLLCISKRDREQAATQRGDLGSERRLNV